MTPWRSSVLLTFSTFIAAAVCAVVLCLTPRLYAGDLTIAAEAGPQVVLTDLDEDLQRWGFGAAGRVGYRFKIPLLSLTPEAKLGYQSPGEPESFSATGGLRLNLFEGVSPAVFAHAGGMMGDLHGFVWDAGLGLDLTMIPLIDLGIFAAYYHVGKANFVDDRVSYQSGNWHWVQFGVQGALHL